MRLYSLPSTDASEGWACTSPVSLPGGGGLGGPLRDPPDPSGSPWQREVDTVAHELESWEWGPREHTLSGILTLTFRAAIGLKEKVVTGNSAYGVVRV